MWLRTPNAGRLRHKHRGLWEVRGPLVNMEFFRLFCFQQTKVPRKTAPIGHARSMAIVQWHAPFHIHDHRTPDLSWPLGSLWRDPLPWAINYCINTRSGGGMRLHGLWCGPMRRESLEPVLCGLSPSWDINRRFFVFRSCVKKTFYGWAKHAGHWGDMQINYYPASSLLVGLITRVGGMPDNLK